MLSAGLYETDTIQSLSIGVITIMSWETKIKILIYSILIALLILLGLMSLAVKGERSKMGGVKELVDDVKRSIEWRQL